MRKLSAGRRHAKPVVRIGASLVSGAMNWTWAFYISGWIVMIVMIPIVMRRKRPTVGTVWLLLIFFQPWAGALLYTMFGENRLPRRRIKKHKRMLAAWRSVAKLGQTQPNVVHPLIDPAHVGLVKLAESLGENPIIGGNDVEVIGDAAEMIDRLVAEIAAAKHHVHLLYYIYEASPAAERVTEAMAAAVKRGVACRVLADSVGSWYLFGKMGTAMREQGIELVESLPVNPFRRRFARLDLRNHRKLAIIDGAVAYTGSQNINDPVFGSRKLPWYEITLRLTGPAVFQLQNMFLEDWYCDTDQVLDTADLFPGPVVAGEAPVQALPSGPTYPTENYQQLVIEAIYAAQRRVVITTPYLVPDEPFMQAIQSCVLRGVRVQVIVPKSSDQWLTDIAGRAFFSSLLGMGVEVYQHTQGLLHSKTMTIDEGFSLVGSSNFDIRSFTLNFEINLLLYGTEVTSRVRRLQESYISQSEQVTSEQWCKRHFLAHFVDGCAQVFSPLL